MKKILLCCLLIIGISSCGLFRKAQTPQTDNFGYSQMYYSMDKQLCAYQVDSMITVDKLVKLEDWHKMSYSNMTQYMFIKSLETNNELIYTVTQFGRDTVYKCTKRITNELKK